MAALVRNYTIERGIQFARTISISDLSGPLDLTGVTFEAEIRTSQLPTDVRPFATGTGPLITSFDLEAVDPATNGVLTMSLTIENTLLLERGVFDYDVILTFPSGEKRRILMGLLTVVEITSHD